MFVRPHHFSALEDAIGQFIAAAEANSRDSRALSHLEELLEGHPELHEAVPGLSGKLSECRIAVARAQSQENRPGTER